MPAIASPSETEIQLAQLLETHYAHICDETESIRLLPGAEINSKNYRVTCRKYGKSETYLVKQRLPHMRDGEIEPASMYQTLQHCQKNAHVPRVIQTLDGASHLEDEGHLYAILEYLDAAPYAGDGSLLYQIGREVAALHQSLATLPAQIQDHCARFGSRFHFADGEQTRLFETLKQHARETDAFRSLADVAFVLHAFKNHHPIDPIHPQVIHRDLHGENILVTPDKSIWIIDFDALTYEDRLRDVAFACHRLSCQGPIERSARQIENRASAFLSGYHSRLPLTPEDIAVLPCFITDEALRRTAYILKAIFDHKDTSLAHILPKHMRSLREVPMFQTMSFDIVSQKDRKRA